MNSEIIFFDYSKQNSILDGIRERFKSIIEASVSQGDRVAVKVHMGEYGNLTYIRPPFVREFVELVKAAGGRPFVTDTTTLYPKNRFTSEQYLKTAVYNGFTGESVGAPIVIADGLMGHDGVDQRLRNTIDGCEISRIKVAGRIADSDSMIVLTHAKGHMLSGFGGSIKNLAMGCTTKGAKAVQHRANRVVLSADRCNGCGRCVEACPFDAIRIRRGKHTKVLSRCMSCISCYFECPEGALHLPKGAKTRFQVNLAHAAKAVTARFREGKIAYINFLQDITRFCDCATPSGNPLLHDIGILGGTDPVAIDKASIDLIDNAPTYQKYPKRNRRDILGILNGTSSLIHIRTAQRLELGSMNYKLVKT
ncbi:DUF362 domain-containing protein [Candidatus Bathyarchaeota archaeon]|nr:DUF362 domain-containing protein [Candidatus Bathyarchaeota archaeon]